MHFPEKWIWAVAWKKFSWATAMGSLLAHQLGDGASSLLACLKRHFVLEQITYGQGLPALTAWCLVVAQKWGSQLLPTLVPRDVSILPNWLLPSSLERWAMLSNDLYPLWPSLANYLLSWSWDVLGERTCNYLSEDLRPAYHPKRTIETQTCTSDPVKLVFLFF